MNLKIRNHQKEKKLFSKNTVKNTDYWLKLNLSIIKLQLLSFFVED